MAEAGDRLIDRIGRGLANKLINPPPGPKPEFHTNYRALSRTLQPGDVLLVEGHSRVSMAIKYLTMSTWSHSALYVGDALGETTPEGESLCLIEVEVGQGCIAVPLSKYRQFNVRICRPGDLTPEDLEEVVGFMISSIGMHYDMRNIFDLLRYFLPQPPVPERWRRQMLSFGSGDPTRAICSSLIAHAFQRVRYPILPKITREFREDPHARHHRREILHIRHHSLFAPRDFDLSPYFHIVKPTLVFGFDYRQVQWSEAPPPPEALTAGSE